jgi:hypothetical protein
MIFSFASTAFAANTDWTDYAASTAKTDKAYEAVQVMTGLGIIDGVSDNTLSPNGNFTRAQAAKIITYMLLGTEAGEALGKKTVAESARKFSDYTYNTIWAVPYVEYCAEVGIVEGYEDGNFYPNRNVTATQWLKMLVAALRYDANKLNGKDWAKYTYDAAIAYGVITADEFKLDFDRETAILYAFNALTCDKWTSDSMAKSRYDLQEEIIYDEFARPTKRVVLSGKTTVAEFTITATNKYEGTVKKTSGIYFVEDGYDNRASVGDTLGGKSATVYEYSNYALGENCKNAGVHKYVYGQDYGKTTVVINTYVEKLSTAALTKEYAKLDTDETLKIGDVVTYNVGNKWNTTKATTIEEVKLNVARVTGVAGTVTGKYCDSSDAAAKNYVKIDYGTAVNFARNAKDGTQKSTDPLRTLSTGIKYALYYDAYGNIIYAEDYTEPAREGDLVFLIKATATATPVVTDGEGVKYNTTYKIQYMDLTDGSLKTATVALDKGQTTPANFPSMALSNAISTATDNKAYPILSDAADVKAYYEIAANEDGTVDILGEYKFTVAGGTEYGTESTASVKKNTAEYTVGAYNGLADSNTTLTVISYKDAFETETYVTEAGIAKFTTAAYELGETYTTAVVAENGYATHIYVIAPVAIPETTYVYAMYLSEGEDDIDDGQSYQFIGSDGETFEITYAQNGGKKPNAQNGSDGFADIMDKTIAKGDVVKLTKQNGEFINAEKLSVAKSDELINRDFNNINVGGTVVYYAASFGDKFIGTTTYAASVPSIKGRDDNGLFAAGSTVNVYTDNGDATGKVVFATVVTSAS